MNDFVIENGVLKKYQGSGGAVVIPDSVTSIGGRAFRECQSIVSVVIPSSVHDIDDYAFWGCGSLQSVELHEGIGYIRAEAFQYCCNLNTINFPESLYRISRSAFYECKSLTSLHFLSRVYIEDYAFGNCENLSAVTFSDAMSIENHAFDGTNCQKFSENFCIIGNALQKCYAVGDVTLPDTVTVVNNWVFCENKELTSVIIPDNIIAIAIDAFYGCESLISVTIGSNLKYVVNFSGCTNLETVTIKSANTSISIDAFKGCKNLRDIVIPENILQTLSYSDFKDCRYLETINGKSLWQGEFKIFQDVLLGCGCYSDNDRYYYDEEFRYDASDEEELKDYPSLVIPDGTTRITSHVDFGSGLVHLVIPDSVETIEGIDVASSWDWYKADGYENIENINHHLYNTRDYYIRYITRYGVKLDMEDILGSLSWIVKTRSTFITYGQKVYEYRADADKMNGYITRILNLEFRRFPHYSIFYEIALEMFQHHPVNKDDFLAYVKYRYKKVNRLWLENRYCFYKALEVLIDYFPFKKCETMLPQNAFDFFESLLKKSDIDKAKIAEAVLTIKDYVTKDNIDECIELAIDNRAYEVQVLLMDYKADKIGYSDPMAKFKL